MRRFVLLSVIGVVLLSCASCGQQDKKHEAVRGQVRYRGTVVGGGTIVFAPDPDLGGDGPLAVAELAPDGSYTLHTTIQDGAPSGPYRVTIASTPTMPIPQKYSDPVQAGLKREVKAGQVNVFDFNLE